MFEKSAVRFSSRSVIRFYLLVVVVGKGLR